MGMGDVFAQATTIDFPDWGPYQDQKVYLYEGFSKAWTFFNIIANHKSSLYYLALTGALIGALIILFRPSLQKFSIIFPWLIMVIVLLFAPYKSNLLFHPVELNIFDPSKYESKQTKESKYTFSAFMPQILVIHVFNTLHRVIDSAFFSCDENGNNCKLRDFTRDSMSQVGFGDNPYIAFKKPSPVPYQISLFQKACGNPSFLMRSYSELLPKIQNKLNSQYFTLGFIINENLTFYKTPSLVNKANRAFLFGPNYDYNNNPFVTDSSPRTLPPYGVIYTNAASASKHITIAGIDSNDSIEIIFEKAFEALHKMQDLYFFQKWKTPKTAAQVAKDIDLTAAIGNNALYHKIGFYTTFEGNPGDNAAAKNLLLRLRAFGLKGDYADKAFEKGMHKYLENPFIASLPVMMGVGYNMSDPTNYDVDAPEPKSDFLDKSIIALNGLLNSNMGIAYSVATGNKKIGKIIDHKPLVDCADFQKHLRNLSLTDIYTNMGISRENIIKILRASTDITPINYVQPNAPSTALSLWSNNFWYQISQDQKGASFEEKEQLRARKAFADYAQILPEKIMFSIKEKIVKMKNEKVPAAEIAKLTQLYGNGEKPFNDKIYQQALGDLNFLLFQVAGMKDLEVGGVFMQQYDLDDAGVSQRMDKLPPGIFKLPGEFVSGVVASAAHAFVTVGSWIQGVKVATYLEFLYYISNMAMMGILMITPILFLMGVLIPSYAPGILIISIFSVLIIKMLPIAFTIIGAILSLMKQASAGKIDDNILMFAAAGLYTSIVGIAMFILFKIGDPSSLAQMQQLDKAANQIADETLKYTKILATATAVTAGVGIAAGFSAKAGIAKAKAAGLSGGKKAAAEAFGQQKLGDYRSQLEGDKLSEFNADKDAQAAKAASYEKEFMNMSEDEQNKLMNEHNHIKDAYATGYEKDAGFAEGESQMGNRALTVARQTLQAAAGGLSTLLPGGGAGLKEIMNAQAEAQAEVQTRISADKDFKNQGHYKQDTDGNYLNAAGEIISPDDMAERVPLSYAEAKAQEARGEGGLKGKFKAGLSHLNTHINPFSPKTAYGQAVDDAEVYQAIKRDQGILSASASYNQHNFEEGADFARLSAAQEQTKYKEARQTLTEGEAIVARDEAIKNMSTNEKQGIFKEHSKKVTEQNKKLTEMGGVVTETTKYINQKETVAAIDAENATKMNSVSGKAEIKNMHSALIDSKLSAEFDKNIQLQANNLALEQAEIAGIDITSTKGEKLKKAILEDKVHMENFTTTAKSIVYSDENIAKVEANTRERAVDTATQISRDKIEDKFRENYKPKAQKIVKEIAKTNVLEAVTAREIANIQAGKPLEYASSRNVAAFSKINRTANRKDFLRRAAEGNSFHKGMEKAQAVYYSGATGEQIKNAEKAGKWSLTDKDMKLNRSMMQMAGNWDYNAVEASKYKVAALIGQNIRSMDWRGKSKIAAMNEIANFRGIEAQGWFMKGRGETMSAQVKGMQISIEKDVRYDNFKTRGQKQGEIKRIAEGVKIREQEQEQGNIIKALEGGTATKDKNIRVSSGNETIDGVHDAAISNMTFSYKKIFRNIQKELKPGQSKVFKSPVTGKNITITADLSQGEIRMKAKMLSESISGTLSKRSSDAGKKLYNHVAKDYINSRGQPSKGYGFTATEKELLAYGLEQEVLDNMKDSEGNLAVDAYTFTPTDMAGGFYKGKRDRKNNS